jgi:cold shock protein
MYTQPSETIVAPETCPFRNSVDVKTISKEVNASSTTRKRSMTTTNGTIKRITDKGFGFIATAEGTEYFFHQSACAGTPFDDLREGQTVSFTVGQGPKGPRAENVNVR